jgi:Zn-dependent peptidase ImmA (M78 family)/DNA-binding XRE family transcriptional regulator
MPKATEVPITPDVLEWAVRESGFSDDAIADAVGVSVDRLVAWKEGTSKPSLTQFRKLASKLHRPLATFLLPEAPTQATTIHVDFRDISGRPSRSLNPQERRYVRRAHRIQQVLAWVAIELNELPEPLPRYAFSDEPEGAGSAYRALLKVRIDEQRAWKTASKAFDHWRAAVEGLGCAVFLFPLGDKACRGFSLWDNAAPLIAINTAWREEARIYTLFHEVGHLATRTNSACAEWAGDATRSNDPTERWCERFSAALLLPENEVRQLVPPSVAREGVRELQIPLRIADRFKVSLRAATLRLIELRLADWGLYEQIPTAADSKRPSGGGSGRNRLEIRVDEFGSRGTSLFVEAVKKDLLSRSQAVEYLDIPDQAFDQLAESSR